MESLRKDAKKYDYGILWHTGHNGRSFTRSFPLLQGKLKDPYYGSEVDWREKKIFDVLNKHIKKDEKKLLEIVGNHIPREIYVKLLSHFPMEMVKRGDIFIPNADSIWNEKNYRSGHWYTSRGIFFQVGRSLLEFDDGSFLWENLNPKKMALAAIASAIKIGFPRESLNVIPPSCDREWEKIIKKSQVFLEEHWDEIKKILIRGLSYQCPQEIENLL